LPAGYLNALENRLVDTEMALFQSLCEIYGTEYQLLDLEPIPPPHLSKSRLMEEWKRLPQRDQNQSRRWWIAKRPNLAYLWTKRQGKVADGANISITENESAIQSISSPYEHHESTNNDSDQSRRHVFSNHGQSAQAQVL
jgi:hypothetical protein